MPPKGLNKVVVATKNKTKIKLLKLPGRDWPHTEKGITEGKQRNG